MPAVGRNTLLLVAFGVALPILVIISMSDFMISNYTGGLHPSEFFRAYSTGVYRYRSLGRTVVEVVYQNFSHHFRERPFPTPRDPEGSFLLVAALAVVNGIAYFCSNILLLRLLWPSRTEMKSEVISIYIFYTFLLTMSMAVVTPYDQISYLFFLVGVLSTKVKNISGATSVMAVSALLGMLTRETELLLLPLLFALAMLDSGVASRRYVFLGLIHLVICSVVFVAQRLHAVGPMTLSAGLTMGGKWATGAGATIVCLMAAFISLCLRIKFSIRPAVYVLLLSLPYLLVIGAIGEIRELRLSIPVFLCVMLAYVMGANSEMPARVEVHR